MDGDLPFISTLQQVGSITPHTTHTLGEEASHVFTPCDNEAASSLSPADIKATDMENRALSTSLSPPKKNEGTYAFFPTKEQGKGWN